MRIPLGAAMIGACLLGGCAYHSTPQDRLRIVDSPSEVSRCRSLGTVGEPVRTDGTMPVFLNAQVFGGSNEAFFGSYGGQSTSDNLAPRIDAMKETAISRGATDLLLTRRFLRDWSYIQGTAYRCRH